MSKKLPVGNNPIVTPKDRLPKGNRPLPPVKSNVLIFRQRVLMTDGMFPPVYDTQVIYVDFQNRKKIGHVS